MTRARAKWLALAVVAAALLVAGLAAAIAARPSTAQAAAPPAVCDHSTGPKTFTLDLTTGPAACGGAVGGCDSTVNTTLPACWTCTSATTAHPLDLDDVTVIVNADVVKEGVRFGPGCTGHIGKLTVVTQGGDGIKTIKGAHDLVIGGGSVTCHEPTGAFTTDQYGIRAFGGDRITFAGMNVNCRTANSRMEFFVNQVPTRASGAPAADAPNRVLFVQGCLASGPWNTALVGTSTNSGIATSTLHAFDPAPPGPNNGPTYSIPSAPSGGGPAASHPLDFSNDTPAGLSNC